MDMWYSDVSREPAHRWWRAIASGKIGALEAGSCGMYEGIKGEPYIQEFAGIRTTKTLYRNNHVSDEMWTGDWWWNTQVKLPSTHNSKHELMRYFMKEKLTNQINHCPPYSIVRQECLAHILDNQKHHKGHMQKTDNAHHCPHWISSGCKTWQLLWWNPLGSTISTISLLYVTFTQTYHCCWKGRSQRYLCWQTYLLCISHSCGLCCVFSWAVFGMLQGKSLPRM